MAVALLCAVLGVPGCDGGGPASSLGAGAGSYKISTDADEVDILPNESKTLVFRLSDSQSGRMAAGRVLQFVILDPGMARGATLSLDRAVTGPQGTVQVQVIAGFTTSFKIQVTATGADPATVKVYVDAQKRGPMEVAPIIVAPADLTATVGQVRITFIHDSSCAAVDRSKPVSSMFDPRAVAPGGTTIFRSVSIERNHAVVGQGLDASGAVRVDGCVDLPGRTVMVEGLMRLVVPLYPLAVSPVGRYKASSLLTLQGMPKAVAAVVDSYAELPACRSEPGRLWLDCTVDALSPETAEDPLDCKPSVADEGVFEGRLAALRGLRDPQRPTTRCRLATDGAGRPSLETQIEGMFAGQPRLVENLSAIAGEVAALFAGFRVTSTMTVSATSDPLRFQLEHQLDQVVFTLPSEPATIDLLALGLPVRTARFVPVTLKASELFVDRHSFTLRLGSAARLALQRNILPRRGYSGTIVEVVTRMFASATYLDRGTLLSGCAALSALVCPLVRGPDQCVVPACTAGVAALARNLNDVFRRLDGADMDLFVEGSTRIVETDGDGKADALGWLVAGSPDSLPGFWFGHVVGSEEQIALGGLFTADRLKP